jgi:hypothetical protein
MNNQKLMEAAEAVVRINGRLKEEGWEIVQFEPRSAGYGNGVRLVLEITRIDENPNRTPKPQD